jgi:seryl-tRNA synthetase
MSFLKQLLDKVTSLLLRADHLIKSYQSKCSTLEQANEDLKTQVADLKEFVATLQSENEGENLDISNYLVQLEKYMYPEVPAEVEEEIDEAPTAEENSSPLVDEFVEVVVEAPETGLTSEEVPTVGTPEETPQSEVESAVEAVIEAIQAEITFN